MPTRQARVSAVAVPAVTIAWISDGASGPTCLPSTPRYHWVRPGSGGGPVDADVGCSAGLDASARSDVSADAAGGAAPGWRDWASCAPRAAPTPIPTPAPAIPPGFCAASVMAVAAWYFANWS